MPNMAAPKKSDGQFYLLRNIPADVWTAAKARAEAYDPPVSLRYVIIELLRKWGKQTTPAERQIIASKPVDVAAKPARKARAVRAPKVPKTDAPVSKGSDAPDLGSSF